MADFAAREVRRILVGKLGCEQRNTDHLVFDLVVDGKVVAWTKISHGAKAIPDGLVAAMARQLKVRPGTFRGLISCNVQKDDFIRETIATLGS